MGLIVEEHEGIETVGELVSALQKFPADMPVGDGLSNTLRVYRVKPQRGECVDDKRGRVVVEDGAEAIEREQRE